MGKKVLVADDNTTNRDLLGDVLERFRPYGLEVLMASNGKEALEIVERDRPDLVLLDIMMPEVSGYEVCQKIKTTPELAQVYVIMVSAKTQQEDRRQAVHAGADEYVTKPYDIRLIRERVQAILDLKPL
jgi:CheY-like chemotaxis protein